MTLRMIWDFRRVSRFQVWFSYKQVKGTCCPAQVMSRSGLLQVTAQTELDSEVGRLVFINMNLQLDSTVYVMYYLTDDLLCSLFTQQRICVAPISILTVLLLLAAGGY